MTGLRESVTTLPLAVFETSYKVNFSVTMEATDTKGILDFIRHAEQLKNVTRSAWTSDGHRESVAEHTWRLCLMALLFEKSYPEIDIARLIKICIIHDLGEAIGGDIPAPLLEKAKAGDERRDLLLLLTPLPQPLQAEIVALWDEYAAGSSAVAKLAKALDKIETLIQHNQGIDDGTIDYHFNLEYGKTYTSQDPLLSAIRELIDSETKQRARASR